MMHLLWLLTQSAAQMIIDGSLQANECKNYDINLDKKTHIVVNSLSISYTLIIFQDKNDPCESKEDFTLERTWEIKKHHNIAVLCTQPCQFQIGILQGQDLIELAKEKILIATDATVIFQEIKFHKTLAEPHHLAVELQTVNWEQGKEQLDFNLSLILDNMQVHSQITSLGTKLVQYDNLTLDNTKKSRAFIIITSQLGNVFKVFAEVYGKVRSLHMNRAVHSLIGETPKVFLLDLASLEPLHRNKSIYLSLITSYGRLDATYLHNGSIPDDLTHSLWTESRGDFFRVIPKEYAYEMGEHLYIRIRALIPSAILLKVNTEGTKQYLDHKQIIHGTLQPWQVIRDFEINRAQNIHMQFTSFNLSCIGQFLLRVSSTNSSQFEKEVQEVSQQINEVGHVSLKMNSKLYKLELVASENTSQFRIDVNLNLKPVLLEENEPFEFTSLFDAKQSYELNLSEHDLHSVLHVVVNLVSHYGVVDINGSSSQELKLAPLSSPIWLHVSCWGGCDYTIDFRVIFKPERQPGSRNQTLRYGKAYEIYVESTITLELDPSLYPSEAQLEVGHQETFALTIFDQAWQSKLKEDAYYNGNRTELIQLTNFERYLKITTDNPQFIRLRLIQEFYHMLRMNQELTQEILENQLQLFQYRMYKNSNLTLIIESLSQYSELEVTVEYQQPQRVQIYKNEGTQHLVRPPLDGHTGQLWIKVAAKRKTSYQIKAQEMNEYYFIELKHSTKIFLNHSNHLKVVIPKHSLSTSDCLYFSLQMMKQQPFIFYLSARNTSSDFEFPSESNYDSKIFSQQSSNKIEFGPGISVNNLNSFITVFITIAFESPITQLIYLSVSENMIHIYPKTPMSFSLKEKEIQFFQIKPTELGVPVWFQFDKTYDCKFILYPCSRYPSKEDFHSDGYNLMRHAVIKFDNIHETCYQGGLLNNAASVQTMLLSWWQQNYTIVEYEANTLQTILISNYDTFILVQGPSKPTLTFFSSSPILVFIWPKVFADDMPKLVNHVNSLKESEGMQCKDCKIGNLYDYTYDVGAIIKVSSQLAHEFSVLMKDQDSDSPVALLGDVHFVAKLDGTVAYTSNAGQNKKLSIAAKVGKLDIEIYLRRELLYREQIDSKLAILRLDQESSPDENYFIQISSADVNVMAHYELQIQTAHTKLLFNQIYIRNSAEETYILPYVTQPQKIYIGFGFLNYESNCNGTQLILPEGNLQLTQHSLQHETYIDQNLSTLTVQINCEPQQTEGYFLYIKSQMSDLAMLAYNLQFRFTIPKGSSQSYFLHANRIGKILIEITQIRGRIIPNAAKEESLLSEGTTDYQVSLFQNYHLKMLITIEEIGFMLFRVKCQSSIEYEDCSYQIQVKEVKGFLSDLQGIKLGYVRYTEQQNSLQIAATTDFQSEVKSLRYRIHFNSLGNEPVELEAGEEISIYELGQSRTYERIFVEVELLIRNTDITTWFLYEPLELVQSKQLERTESEKGNQALVTNLLLAGIFGLLAFAVYFLRRQYLIKKQSILNESALP